MNIFDILICYREKIIKFACKETANSWLEETAKDQKWNRWFIDQIKSCVNDRGDYIRELGMPGYIRKINVKSLGITTENSVNDNSESFK